MLVLQGQLLQGRCTEVSFNLVQMPTHHLPKPPAHAAVMVATPKDAICTRLYLITIYLYSMHES